MDGQATVIASIPCTIHVFWRLVKGLSQSVFSSLDVKRGRGGKTYGMNKGFVYFPFFFVFALFVYLYLVTSPQFLCITHHHRSFLPLITLLATVSSQTPRLRTNSHERSDVNEQVQPYSSWSWEQIGGEGDHARVPPRKGPPSSVRSSNVPPRSFPSINPNILIGVVIRSRQPL